MITPTLLIQRATVSSLEADHYHATRELDRKLSTETSSWEGWMKESFAKSLEECYANLSSVSAKLNHERAVYADMQLQSMKQSAVKAPIKVQQLADDEIDFIY